MRMATLAVGLATLGVGLGTVSAQAKGVDPDLAKEIRKIVREEIRAAIREMHGTDTADHPNAVQRKDAVRQTIAVRPALPGAPVVKSPEPNPIRSLVLRSQERADTAPKAAHVAPTPKAAQGFVVITEDGEVHVDADAIQKHVLQALRPTLERLDGKVKVLARESRQVTEEDEDEAEENEAHEHGENAPHVRVIRGGDGETIHLRLDGAEGGKVLGLDGAGVLQLQIVEEGESEQAEPQKKAEPRVRVRRVEAPIQLELRTAEKKGDGEQAVHFRVLGGDAEGEGSERVFWIQEGGAAPATGDKGEAAPAKVHAMSLKKLLESQQPAAPKKKAGAGCGCEAGCCPPQPKAKIMV